VFLRIAGIRLNLQLKVGVTARVRGAMEAVCKQTERSEVVTLDTKWMAAD